MLSRSTSVRALQSFSTTNSRPFVHCRSHSKKSHFHDVALGSGIEQPVKMSPMARIPTRILFRSLLLTSLMTSSTFLRPALAVMGVLSTSKSTFLDPDRNIFLNRFLRWTVYNHFCAGTSRKEVSKTVADIKKIGYQGVILGYSREVVLDHNETVSADEFGNLHYSEKCYKAIEQWKSGTLETLGMIGPGDFLGVK